MKCFKVTYALVYTALHLALVLLLDWCHLDTFLQMAV